MLKNQSEIECLEALRKDCRKSFKWLYNRYFQDIYTYVSKFLYNKALAEEATTDVFFLLWKKRGQIDTRRSVKGFLYKVARDTTFNYLKKIASDKRLKAEFLAAYTAGVSEDAESIMMEQEELQAVSEIIEQLPPKRREVFQLRYFEGKDNEAIAHQLEISINTVKVHLVKARQYLRQHLSLSRYVWLIIFLNILS